MRAAFYAKDNISDCYNEIKNYCGVNNISPKDLVNMFYKWLTPKGIIYKNIGSQGKDINKLFWSDNWLIYITFYRV